ncbi:MAG TPA: acyl-CoA dehydrogenase family protein [Stellaceae bacterium]|nr:acyl-CoA dehydrogenase family protein [Stellaceae bacterium]
MKNKKAAVPGLKPIAPPEPGLTVAAMIARAVALRPELRARQTETERAGRLSDDMNRKFVEAGFYRAVQPRIFGGYELSVPDFMRVMLEVARGCAESAWVLALTAGHTHMLAGFPAEGQIEVYGADGEFRAPGVPPPSAHCVPAPGGVRVTGGWDYVSGCDVATHFIGGVALRDPATGAPDGSALVVIDRADYSIRDNWHMVGMQGTGSKRIEVKDLFVPEYRTMRWTNPTGELSRDRPGRSIHANPMYFGRNTPFLVAESSSVVVGAAYGALDCYEEAIRTKKTPWPPFPYRYELGEFQHNYGRARTLIDTAHAALLQVGQQFMDICAREAAGGEPFSVDEERRLQMIEQQCIHLAYEAVDIMFRTAGSSSAQSDAPLGRFWRNIAVIRTHLAHQSDSAATNYGRVHFGLPPMGRI